MGKRSDFERIPRDFYPTPESAVIPLLPHLKRDTLFIEPCAGDGRLVDHLRAAGHECYLAMDIEPRREDIDCNDILDENGWWLRPTTEIDCYITNPPWARPTLHAIIERLSSEAPTWLLFDADWMHTKQAAPYMPWLRKVVSVGRVKWFEDSPFTGKDNCCWYLFDQNSEAPAVFIGRAA